MKDEKKCSVCATAKLLSSFYCHKTARHPEGIPVAACKDCARIRTRKYYADHKPEQKIAHKKYVEEHKKETRKRQSAWRERNKEQQSAYWKKYHAEHIEQHRANNLRNHRGIEIGVFAEMFNAQGGVCKICGLPQKEKNLAVDHDHITGKIRSLLCSHCNAALGFMKDDETLLRRAADYLESFKEGRL